MGYSYIVNDRRFVRLYLNPSVKARRRIESMSVSGQYVNRVQKRTMQSPYGGREGCVGVRVVSKPG